jgi:hypothetical protein
VLRVDGNTGPDIASQLAAIYMQDAAWISLVDEDSDDRTSDGST